MNNHMQKSIINMYMLTYFYGIGFLTYGNVIPFLARGDHIESKYAIK